MAIDPISAVGNAIKGGLDLGGKIVSSVTRLKLAKNGDKIQEEQNASDEFKLVQQLQNQYTNGDPNRTWLDMIVDNAKRMMHPLIGYPFIALFWIYIISPFFRFIENESAIQLINDYIAIINSLGGVLPLVLGSLLGVRQIDKAIGVFANFKTSQLAVQTTNKSIEAKASQPENINVTEISKKGVDSLRVLEGERVRDGLHFPYDDQTGEFTNKYVKGATIGYGHLIKNRNEFEQYENGIHENEALELLDNDLISFEKNTNELVKRKLNQNEFDAIVIFMFNIGVGHFKFSTVRKMINNPKLKTKYDSIESAWKAWNKSQGKIMGGLIARREKEWDIFSKGEYPA